MTAITWALIAPLFFFLVFGALEAGRVFSAWVVITQEAREAARYGAVNHGRTDVDLTTLVLARVDQRVTRLLPRSGLTPAPTVTITNEASPHVVVTIAYQVDLLIPIVDRVFPDPFPVIARSSMRGE